MRSFAIQMDVSCDESIVCYSPLCICIISGYSMDASLQVNGPHWTSVVKENLQNKEYGLLLTIMNVIIFYNYTAHTEFFLSLSLTHIYTTIHHNRSFLSVN